MSDFPAVPSGADVDVPDIRPSSPVEEQPPLPQQLVEIHGWGRAAGAMSHLHGIESVADAVSALRSGAARGVTPRPAPWRSAETASATDSMPCRCDLSLIHI